MLSDHFLPTGRQTHCVSEIQRDAHSDHCGTRVALLVYHSAHYREATYGYEHEALLTEWLRVRKGRESLAYSNVHCGAYSTLLYIVRFTYSSTLFLSI